MIDTLREILAFVAGIFVFIVWHLGLLMGAIFGEATVQSTPDYPVEVTVDFQYAGERYQRTFLAPLHDVRLGSGGIEWQFIPHEFSIALNDGSVLIIPTISLESWRNSASVHPFPQVGAHVENQVSMWLWVDSHTHPTKALDVNFSPKEAPATDFHLFLEPNNTLSARMVRVGSDQLEMARQAARDAEKTRMLGASGSGGRDFVGEGVLFGGLTAVEVTPSISSAIRSLEGWIDTGGGCKILRSNKDNSSAFGKASTSGRKLEPIHLGDGIWKTSERMYPLYRMFRLGNVNIGSGEFINGYQVRSFVRAIDNGMHQCTIPKWDLSTGAIVISFPRMQSIIYMRASLARAILIDRN